MADDAPTSPLPRLCGVAFKEWAGVCGALADGGQTIILRKGGIDEGPNGFTPEHEVFWLYPTHVHQAEQGLRVPPTPALPPPDADEVELSVLVRVVRTEYVGRPETLDALAPFHVWTAETVRKRYHYRRPGLWVLGVRAYRAPAGWRVRVTPEQAGCRTWVPLDPPLATDGVRPALPDEESHARMTCLGRVLEGRADTE